MLQTTREKLHYTFGIPDVPTVTPAERICQNIYQIPNGLIFLEKRNTTTKETVATLRSLLARMGLPDHAVSDNGP